ncbi:MAG: ADP-dependent glucokinase/phosphofructokinase [Thermomicrobiales bacterium]
MSETISREWRQRYAEALARATARAAEARAQGRLIACGLSSNVDRVGTLDDDLLAALFGERLMAADAARVSSVETVDDLLTGIAQCIAAGDGTDLVIRDPAVQEWLLARMPGRIQIGGTGVQAASTLTTLGFPALVHLTGRSPQQIAALETRELMWLGTGDGLIPVAQGEIPDDETMWHPALEFEAGLRAPFPGRPAAPAANRVLIGYDPVNANLRIDPGFSAAVQNLANEIDVLLISGFTQLHDPEVRERVFADARAALAAWRAARPELFIHLELGAMPDFRHVRQIVAELHPWVSSIGMNIDELRELLAVEGVTMAAPGPALVAQMRAFSAQFPTPRFSVHTREFCLTLTAGDPATERDALIFGSLTAATRARIAAFPRLDDLAATLAQGTINDVGLALVAALAGEPRVVVTPGVAFPGPTATVGLGDSFTGGLLAMV